MFLKVVVGSIYAFLDVVIGVYHNFNAIGSIYDFLDIVISVVRCEPSVRRGERRGVE